MRTTLSIDDDVLTAARQLASTRGITLGEAVSELARATLMESRSAAGTRNGIALLPPGPLAGAATLDHVNALRDESP